MPFNLYRYAAGATITFHLATRHDAEHYNRGGMRSHTHTIVISDGDSFENNTGEEDNNHVSFNFTAAELDSLPGFLQKKHFTKITTVRSKHIIRDMGSSTIELQWRNQLPVSVQVPVWKRHRLTKKINRPSTIIYSK